MQVSLPSHPNTDPPTHYSLPNSAGGVGGKQVPQVVWARAGGSSSTRSRCMGCIHNPKGRAELARLLPVRLEAIMLPSVSPL